MRKNMTTSLKRFFLCSLLILAAIHGAPIRAEKAAELTQAQLTEYVNRLHVKSDESLIHQIISGGDEVHEWLYEGEPVTAELRALLRKSWRQNRDAKRLAQGLNVHEWGAIVSFQGHDSATVGLMRELRRDLPHFVERWENQAYAPRIIMKPIIYFYTDKPVSVDVMVNSSQGMLSQWYPKVSYFSPQRMPGGIPNIKRSYLSWRQVRIDPQNPPEAKLFANPENDHPWWSIIRDVDAAALTVNRQAEKFLFYRGAISAKSPIKVSGDELTGEYTVKNQGAAARHFMLVRVQNGQVDFKYVRNIPGHAEMKVKLQRSALDKKTQIENASAVWQEALEESGLFPKEANGLLRVWQHDFFGSEGARFIHVMNRSEADRLLNLTIKPRPSHLVRTMIHWNELMTTTLENRVLKLIDDLGHKDVNVRQAAENDLLAAGVFVETYLRAKLKETKNMEVRFQINAILSQLSEDAQIKASVEKLKESDARTGAKSHPRIQPQIRPQVMPIKPIKPIKPGRPIEIKKKPAK